MIQNAVHLPRLSHAPTTPQPSSSRSTAMVYLDPVGVDWPLPVEKEHLILQLSPVAMAKHLNDVQLLSELSALQPRKYHAIFSEWLETPSIDKPWHLCEVYILHEIAPAQMTKEEYDKQTPKPVASMAPKALTESLMREFPPPALKETYYLQAVYARIHTRLCDVPRAAPRLFLHGEDKQWIHVRHTLERESEFEPMSDVAVECRRCVVKKAKEPASQPSTTRSDNEGLPPWGEEEQKSLYLLPHFEYSFDLNQDVAVGKFWEEEHAEIVSLLRARVPSIPERGRVPRMWLNTNYSREEARAHFIEHPRSESPATELRKRHFRRYGMDDDRTSDYALPPPETLLGRLLGSLGRVLISCIPKPSKPKAKVPVREYVDTVDEARSSILACVGVPAPPSEKPDQVVVPPSDVKHPSKERKSLLQISKKKKQPFDFVDRPFIPFVTSYKAEKQDEKDEARDSYGWSYQARG